MRAEAHLPWSIAVVTARPFRPRAVALYSPTWYAPNVRLHLLGFPHTQTTRAYVTCAYTQKLVKFAKMMVPFDHEVYVYSGEHNEAPCHEHVPIFTDEEQHEWYGDWRSDVCPDVDWDPASPGWTAINERGAAEILKRAGPGAVDDLVLSLAGHSNAPLRERGLLPEFQIVEWGVGYEGIYFPHRCFESHAWQHYVYGRKGITNGCFYDTVIPNFFDPADFQTSGRAAEQSYLLFVGRLVHRKGWQVALDVAERAGIPIRIAGPGVEAVGDGLWVGPEARIQESDSVTYLGVLDQEERARQMAGAVAVLAPTLYLEPFGGVAVEAMMCGTPAITTDFGAFPETVPDDLRFRTLQEAVECVDRARGIDRSLPWNYARENFSLEAVGPQYERWFRQLQGLWGKGWDA